MAITDNQLDTLKKWAYELGKDGVLNDPTDAQIVAAVFDRADIERMRTEDEFDAIVTEDDLPAPEDHRDIVAAYDEGVADAWLKDSNKA